MIALLFALSGTWVQACRSGYSRSETFAGGQATYVERNFGDDTCTEPSVVTTSRGSVELGGAVAEPMGAQALDFTFESVSLKPVSESAASLWRERGVCGISDWRAGEERDVTARECDFSGGGLVTRVPARGERRYGVVKAGEGALYFGRLSPERNGSTPERRPIDLDPTPYAGPKNFENANEGRMRWGRVTLRF